MAELAQINPKMLSWARETAGLSISKAAEKLGLRDTAKATATEKLQALENGDGRLNRATLQKAAVAFRRPVITFYLAQPPRRGERGEDFRSASGSVSPFENGMLDALVRDVRARQQIVRGILDDEDEAILRPFVGSSDLREGAAAVSAKIRNVFGLTRADQREAKHPAHLFSMLKSAAEHAGIFVLLLGDLGSHHSDLSDQVFRGFALADDVAPFVVINDNDATTARSFTLMHELAHLWIGASGVSGPLKGVSSGVVERFCNDVAGDFLLPPEALTSNSRVQGADADRALAVSEDVARDWKVSQGVVIYRLARNGWISVDVASRLFAALADRWRRQKQREREERDPDSGSPTHYQLRRSGVGAPLLNLVRRAIQGQTLTRSRAAKVLGVKAPAVDVMLQERSRAA